MEGTECVNVHLAQKVLLRLVVEANGAAGDPSIGDRYQDFTASFPQRIDTGFHRRLIGHIQFDDECVAASGFNLSYRLGGPVQIDVGHADCHAVAGEAGGDAPADAASRAGYYGDRGTGWVVVHFVTSLGLRKCLDLPSIART